jgi:hypothetical protein
MALTPEARARAKKRKEARDKLKDSQAENYSNMGGSNNQGSKKGGSKKAASNVKALRKGLKEDGLKERKRPGGRGR